MCSKILCREVPYLHTCRVKSILLQVHAYVQYFSKVIENIYHIRVQLVASLAPFTCLANSNGSALFTWQISTPFTCSKRQVFGTPLRVTRWLYLFL